MPTVEELVAENIRLGAEAEAIQAKRRAINAEIARAQQQIAADGVVAPGGVVVVDGEEALRMMLGAKH